MKFGNMTPIKRFGLVSVIASSGITIFMAFFWILEKARYSSDLDDFIQYFYNQTLGACSALLFLLGISFTSGLPEQLFSWIKTGTWPSKKEGKTSRLVLFLHILLFLIVAYISFDNLGHTTPSHVFNP